MGLCCAVCAYTDDACPATVSPRNNDSLDGRQGLLIYFKRCVDRVIKKVLITSLALIPLTVQAQGIETYADALERSLSHNPGLLRTFFEFAASRERVDVVSGELRPSVDLSAND